MGQEMGPVYILTIMPTVGRRYRYSLSRVSADGFRVGQIIIGTIKTLVGIDC